MEILKKIDWLLETTLTTDIEQNKAKGHVPVIGMVYRKKKKKSKLTGADYVVHEQDDEYDENGEKKKRKYSFRRHTDGRKRKKNMVKK